jgi:hypothetical protein
MPQHFPCFVRFPIISGVEQLDSPQERW